MLCQKYKDRIEALQHEMNRRLTNTFRQRDEERKRADAAEKLNDSFIENQRIQDKLLDVAYTRAIKLEDILKSNDKCFREEIPRLQQDVEGLISEARKTKQTIESLKRQRNDAEQEKKELQAKLACFDGACGYCALCRENALIKEREELRVILNKTQSIQRLFNDGEFLR